VRSKHEKQNWIDGHENQGRRVVQLNSDLLPKGKFPVACVERIPHDPVEEDEGEDIIANHSKLPGNGVAECLCKDEPEQERDDKMDGPAALFDCPGDVLGDVDVLVPFHARLGNFAKMVSGNVLIGGQRNRSQRGHAEGETPYGELIVGVKEEFCHANC